MTNILAVTFASLIVVGCGEVVMEEPEDGADDRFLTDGHAGVRDGSPDAIGVLQLVNALTASELEREVGISPVAAQRIEAVRLGGDGRRGTVDDTVFVSLAQLDDVPFVGPAVFEKLLAYGSET